MQLQHALFLRSVKQRTEPTSTDSSFPPVDLLSSFYSTSGMTTPSSSPSILSVPSALGFQRQPEVSFAPAAAPVPAAIVLEPEKMIAASNDVMKNQLEELERRLLDDDDDEVTVTGASGLTTTTTDWSETIQQLMYPPLPPPPPSATVAAAAQSPQSPSPANLTSSSSSSSTVSSCASCSPPSSAPPFSAPSTRQMLLDTAVAIADGNLEAATANIAILKHSANPRGDAEQRLTAMMVNTLLSRLNTQQQQRQPQIESSASDPMAELCNVEHFAATQMLYEISPCFKLGLFAANYAILEATKDQPKIHILDFEVGNGGQYAALLHAVLERHHHRHATCPPAVRITAIVDPVAPFTGSCHSTAEGLRAIGDRIEKLAERNGLAVKFNVVCRRAAELDAAAVGCEPGEALAVNLAFVLSRVADESVSPANPRDELLRRVRSLRPRVVALVEQELNTNTAAFAGRFAEACCHYGALLESLDATEPRESVVRARVEDGLVRKAANSVAREGADRLQRCEVFGKWRARMGMAGFKPVVLGPEVNEPVKVRLASFRSNQGFTVSEVGGLGLGFGWMGRVLTVASAWR